jgi:predicted AAA+ superfamily ATPase
MLPPLPRVPEAQALVERGSYFVLHAPRQSGKTTFLMAFAQALTEGGQYAALYTSCEVGEASGDDAAAAQRAIAPAQTDASR